MDGDVDPSERALGLDLARQVRGDRLDAVWGRRVPRHRHDVVFAPEARHEGGADHPRRAEDGDPHVCASAKRAR